MDFFNKLTKKAKETYAGASKKTGELAKEAKLRMKMNENKSEINDLYQEIGKKVYEKHVLDEEIRIKIDLEEECTKIDILSAEIETCLNQIRALKDKKQCPKCFNEIDLDANFCNHCGAKQEMQEAREVEVVNTENTQNDENISNSTEQVDVHETTDYENNEETKQSDTSEPVNTENQTESYSAETNNSETENAEQQSNNSDDTQNY